MKHRKLKHIALIGSGKIGIRHLEGISKIKFKAKISVIDINAKSLKLAKKIYSTLKINKNITDINFIDSFNSIDKKIDLAIIATNSLNRFHLINNLVNKTEVKNLVIEKVAFQSENEFKKTLRLIKKNKIKAWVNCSGRIQKLYINIKKKLHREKKIEMICSANGYNIASNAIHLLDRLVFFSRSSIAKIDLSELKKKIYKSKRENYLEFKGCFRAYTSRGDELTIIDEEKNKEIFFLINSDNYKISIYPELNVAILLSKSNKWQPHSMDYLAPPQSVLTTFFVNDIIKKGKCGLTNINESYLIHKPMLNSFLQFINNLSKKKINSCMIT